MLARFSQQALARRHVAAADKNRRAFQVVGAAREDRAMHQIAYLLEHRKRTRGDEPIDLGTITEVLYVGQPTWEVGETTLTGSADSVAERLNEFGTMGVSHLQVRFRNRSLGELLDQMDAFGRDVAPQLQRTS